MIGRLSVGGADPCEHALVCEQRFGARGDVWQLQRGCPCPCTRRNVCVMLQLYAHVHAKHSSKRHT